MLDYGLFPIGTVVLLSGSTKKVMITGLCQQGAQNQKLYDYVGVIFPEGFLSPDKMYLFNNDQIEKIFVLGYQDSEQIEFLSKANEIMKKLREEEKK